MHAATLFPDLVFSAPATQGIKYAGSKLKLLPYILRLAQKVNPKSVLDGFAGTTRVSQAFAQTDCRVIANDISAWSRIFATCYLLNPYTSAHFQPLIDHLNSLPGRDGWFTEHYGGDPNDGSSIGVDGLKKPWQRHNTRKLDAIREEIDSIVVTDAEKSVLLTSLMLALDEVDSTLGHFASYLNEWSPRSYNALRLRVPRLLPKNKNHEVYAADIFDIAERAQTDLAYFDPPYGSNNEKMPPSRVRYAAYYHLWTTICLNDRPTLFGKARRRKDTSDVIAGSVFEDFRQYPSGRLIAVEAIEKLLRITAAPHIILSYSSGGRATAEALDEAIRAAGRVIEVIEINHQKNVMASMRWTNAWIRDAETPNTEFLFLIERQ